MHRVRDDNPKVELLFEKTAPGTFTCYYGRDDGLTWPLYAWLAGNHYALAQQACQSFIKASKKYSARLHADPCPMAIGCVTLGTTRRRE
jgi:hypothetical protein